MFTTQAPDNVTAPATKPVAPKPQAMRMSAIKSALPEFFAVDTPALVSALTDKGARIMALGFALAGCAIERAQSGNMPAAWGDTQKAAEALKGATKARVIRALDIVGGIKPAHLKSSELSDYAEFGNMQAALIVDVLTPPATTKTKTPATDWKATAEALKVECALLQSDIATLQALLLANNIKAPALTMAPATV